MSEKDVKERLTEITSNLQILQYNRSVLHQSIRKRQFEKGQQQQLQAASVSEHPDLKALQAVADKVKQWEQVLESTKGLLDVRDIELDTKIQALEHAGNEARDALKHTDSTLSALTTEFEILRAAGKSSRHCHPPPPGHREIWVDESSKTQGSTKNMKALTKR